MFEHNAKKLTWTWGWNEFSDWTNEEIERLHGHKRGARAAQASALARSASGLIQIDDGIERSCTAHHSSCIGEDYKCCGGLICGAEGICLQAEPHPAELDWSEKLNRGYDVMKQGHCGSCWAVAATATVGLMAAKVTGNRFNDVLSPQSAVNCAPNPMSCGGTGGCHGAIAELAFDYWKKNPGTILSLAQQEYTAKDSSDSCSMNGVSEAGDSKSFLQVTKSDVAVGGVSIGGWVRVMPANSVQQVMDALVTAGPLSVAVAAHDFHAYKSGIIKGMSDKISNHAVTLTGYGEATESSLIQGGSSDITKFWKIRNSWGRDWGEKGHARLERATGTEPCGMDPKPEKGSACKDESGAYSQVPERICGTMGILSDVSYPTGVQVAGLI